MVIFILIMGFSHQLVGVVLKKTNAHYSSVSQREHFQVSGFVGGSHDSSSRSGCPTSGPGAAHCHVTPEI